MDISWPFQRRELGDQIIYTCPNGRLTWEERESDQPVSCIWHRQSDQMIWWPQELKDCNRKYSLQKFCIFSMLMKSKASCF